MELFAEARLKLNKNVKKDDKESLLSLFNVEERFKRIEILKDADEGTIVKVALEGMGEIDLKLGNDMGKGQQKTIMTLFWYAERSKPIEIEKDAGAGMNIAVNFWLA